MVELRFINKSLAAEVRITVDEIDDVSISDISDLLKANRVQQQYIDYQKIDRVVSEKIAGAYVEVARAVAPVNGEDGTFEIYFPNEQLKAKPPREREDGSVDHHDLGFVELCHKEDLLMRLYPATKSVPGINVFGEPIAGKDGLPPQVYLGDNLTVSEDGLFVQAAEDGYPLLDQDKNLHVFTTLEINSDVDYSVGNLTFPGDVVINGDVMNGFTIKSDKNITVNGNVESANLIAEEEVVVNGGINQKHGGSIQASVVKANVLQFANIQTKELYVSSEILYSKVHASYLIDVSGDDCRVIGGETICNGVFKANDLGSSKEASKTHIHMKKDDTLQKKIDELDSELEKTYNQHEEINTELKEIENYLSQPNISPSEFHEFEKIYEGYKPKEQELKNQMEMIEQDKQKVLEEMKDIANPELHVYGYLYGGVELYFDTQTLSNTIEKKKTKVFEEHDIVRFLPLDPKPKN